ncbi:MAG: PAS domain S-box protein [Kiloniellales bacterium]
MQQTEQSHTAQSLQDSEAQLRAVFDTAVDGLVVIDGSGTIRSYNRACEALFGFTAEETIGQNVKMLMPAPYREEHDGYIESYRRTGERKIIGIGREVVGQRKDGTTFPMELSVGEARRGGEPIFIGIIRDITERKAAEQALRDSEAQLRAVFDTAVDGLVVIDGSGIIQSYNRACESLFGYRAQEAIGRNVKMLMPAPYREEHDGYIASYRLTGERKIIGIGREVVGQHKDGTTFPMELSVGEARRGNEPIFIGIIRDITERKAAERALKQKAAELLGKNVELEQFAYAASHDLQEPLRMVGSYCELLQRRYAGKLDSDADEFLSYAVDGASRMRALIQDLLRLARLSAHEMVRQPVDCNAVLDRCRIDLKTAIDESRAEITSDPLPVIEGDGTQIGQLFLNLLGNAIKFRDRLAPRVHVSVEEGQGEWRFAVQDNGIGIKPQHGEQVFIIFRRLHGRDAYPGTGVGLSLCRKIVERHGGRIWLDPAVEAGARFCFTIRKPD